ncbi:MAG TPA: asparagine synthase (glutamine-hydrolyzing) [Verrucomicrobiae bacterium]|nr:asparagine synthase (glutamine-hydrolyzing) [Verrucomicrobiae bacterium]
MCGILGSTKDLPRERISHALGLLSHRGPDDEGLMQHGHAWLGHRRLSIIDLSPLGHQPMISADGNLALVFNGEIYNYRVLREELMREGVTFKSHSDTEVILEGFAKHGASFFSRLRGMWAVAISDKRDGSLTLSRDFFGIKPLYYRLDTDGCSFASEASPLAALGGAEPDPQAYALYFLLGLMPGPASGIRGIKQLVPGEILEIKKDGNVASSNVLDQDLLKPKAANLEEVLRGSVAAHFESDVPVSVLLSGGTDSSLIAALAKEQGFDPMCFHVAIEESDDTRYAKEIAKTLGLKLEVLDFSAKELEVSYDAVRAALDLPLSDISLLPTSLVFGAVAKKTKVVLSGDGGDELFGGYYRHKMFAGARDAKPFSLPAFLPNPFLLRLQKSLDKWRKDLAGIYADEASIAYFPKRRALSVEFLNEFRRQHPLAKTAPSELFFDLALYLPYMLMFKNDRMSMMHSLEARVPFVDREVLEAALPLYAPGHHETKAPLKEILAKHVSRELAFRPKQGFGFSAERFLSERIQNDFLEAVRFHEKNAEAFGWRLLGLPESSAKDFYRTLSRKFPRFAFAVITSHAVWQRHGL